MKITLERTANAVVILTCVFVWLRFSASYFGASQPRPAYPKGSVIADTPGLALKSSKLSLLLINRSSCHFCAASMPVYRQLSDASKVRQVRFVSVPLEDAETNRVFLDSNKVAVSAIAPAAMNGITESATPTLILVRRDGKVLGSWAGQLDGRGEQAVLHALE